MISKARLFLLFVLLQLAFTPFQGMNHNTSSRLAAMGSVCSRGTFEISPYLTWMSDWARTPDGRHYSNKAPGGLIIGLPVYCAMDWTFGKGTVQSQWDMHYLHKRVQSLLLQILPWLLVCHLWERRMRRDGLSNQAIYYAQIALLFGSTAAHMMNLWFGHGLVAIFSTLLVLAIMEGRTFWTGTLLGWLLLTEYSSALLFPPALAALALRKRLNVRSVAGLIAGGIIPGTIWIIYHQMAFGSPFHIANHFQNPAFQDKLTEQYQLWGIFGLPSPTILFKLLFGIERGILLSQPWVLLAAVTLPFLSRKVVALRGIVLFCVSSLTFLLLMNASFGGWHGGASCGPRYLTAALPIFAIPLAYTWDHLSPGWRLLYRGTIIVGAVACFFIMTTTPLTGLWHHWFSVIQEHPFDFAYKSALFAILTLVALKWPARSLD